MSGSRASWSSGARTTIRATAVFSGRCSSDFFLRISPSTCAASCSAWAPRSSAPPAAPSNLGLRRPCRRCEPNPAATTTRLPRSQTAGTARTAGGTPRATSAAPCSRSRRARRRDRRSGATSPARDSCRRRTRRRSLSARGRACIGSARDRRSTRERAAPGSSAGRDRRA